MIDNGVYLLGVLFVAIRFIVIATARWRLHAFFALLIAAYGVGLAAHADTGYRRDYHGGFGGLMTSIGLVIVCHVIGVALERSGAAVVLAECAADRRCTAPRSGDEHHWLRRFDPGFCDPALSFWQRSTRRCRAPAFRPVRRRLHSQPAYATPSACHPPRPVGRQCEPAGD